MSIASRNAILAAVILALGACSDDEPVSYSAPVGINLKAKSDDVASGTVSEEKSITTEQANPYGAFVNAARQVLGRDPSSIELTSLTLLLGAGSDGVTMLNEVFDGQVDIQFEMNETNNVFPVGHDVVDVSVAGRGPIDLEVTFDSASFVGQDWTKLLGGSFKVVLAGPAAAGFSGKGAEAELQVTFTFEAFE